jgi:hypothetical protein
LPSEQARCTPRSRSVRAVSCRGDGLFHPK